MRMALSHALPRQGMQVRVFGMRVPPWPSDTQVAIASAVLPLIWKLREQPEFGRRWVPITSTLVALLGIYWFAQRIWF